MRAKQINEFKRGGSPEEKLKIGNHRPYKEGDKIRCLGDIRYIGDNWEWDRKGVDVYFKEDQVYIIDHYNDFGEAPSGIRIRSYSINSWGFDKKDLDKYFERV